MLWRAAHGDARQATREAALGPPRTTALRTWGLLAGEMLRLEPKWLRRTHMYVTYIQGGFAMYECKLYRSKLTIQLRDAGCVLENFWNNPNSTGGASKQRRVDD